MTKSHFGYAAATALLFALSTWHSAPALADPPPWAPAHGWREKHGDDDDDDRGRGRHHHHHEREDDRETTVVVAPPPPPPAPYGLAQGFCSRDLIGAALGGATGGLIGSNIGKGKGRTVATVGGVLVGLFVGGKIGRNMDQLDQACAGQALEHVQDNQTVVWQGQNQQGYWVTPTRSYEAGDGRYCREYTSDALIGGQRQRTYGTACRQPDGSWEIVK
jgi:surface antigen